MAPDYKETAEGFKVSFECKVHNRLPGERIAEPQVISYTYKTGDSPGMRELAASGCTIIAGERDEVYVAIPEFDSFEETEIRAKRAIEEGCW